MADPDADGVTTFGTSSARATDPLVCVSWLRLWSRFDVASMVPAIMINATATTRIPEATQIPVLSRAGGTTGSGAGGVGLGRLALRRSNSAWTPDPDVE